MKSSNRRLAILGASFGLLALAGCAKNKGELVVDDSVGVTALRSPCPLVAIPEMTGDITLFNAPGRTDSGAIDVVASITNLRSTCNDETNGSKLDSAATFDVLARRTDTRGARHIEIPYFSVVMRGGTQVLAKRVGTIGLDFADGQDRASARASATRCCSPTGSTAWPPAPTCCRAATAAASTQREQLGRLGILGGRRRFELDLSSVEHRRAAIRADIAAIREVIGDRLLIVDAIQGFGVVEAAYATADVVCGNGYKWLRAGRGTGFAWFSERAIDRLTPVFSGVTGTDVTHPMTHVPAVVSEARAFTVSPYDPIAHARQAAAVHEVREVGVAAIEAAVTERVDRILELAASAGVATITPSDPARRAGIVALKPPAAEVAPLAASLANAGVTSTTRAGIVRVSAHAGTDEQTLSLFAEALQAFAASRAW